MWHAKRQKQLLGLNLGAIFTLLILTLSVGCGDGDSPANTQVNQTTPAETRPIDSKSKPKKTNPNTFIESKPLPSTNTKQGQTLFQSLPASETGVAFKNVIDIKHPMKRLYHSGFICGGVAIGDVDGDGRPDIYLASGIGSNKLYRQTADFKFVDITESAGVGALGKWGTGAAMVDIDNDGDLDIHVSNYDSANLLFINKGDGTFDEQAKTYGLDIVDACLMASFADFDNDGDLDCYQLTNRYYRKGGRPAKAPVKIVLGQPVILPEFKKYYAVQMVGSGHSIEEVGRPDRLMRNNGDGTFTDVSDKAGLISNGNFGLSVAWWDYNGDNLIDIYVGNDFNDPDYLYRNNGDGTFTEVIKSHIPHTSWFSMGSDAADINNDGRLDFLTVDMSATTHFKQKTSMGAMNAKQIMKVAGPPPQVMRNALYLNTGTERFMEIAYLAGLADSDWSWATKFGDLDNDGRIDVLITNGAARNFSHSDFKMTNKGLVGKTKWDMYEDTPTRPEQNLAFQNTGNLHFKDASKAWGLDHVGMSYSAALSDLDRDGDLDVVVANLEEPVSIYRNSSTGNRVLIRLKGTEGNTYGIGATVRIETVDGVQIRQLKPQNGFISSNEPLIHFGLGQQSRIKKLEVVWPTGEVQVFADLDGNRSYTITEPIVASKELGKQTPRVAAAIKPSLFTKTTALGRVTPAEQPFDDFARQPLLPNRLSQNGPGMAWGDVDGDGDDDVFIGGPAGQPGKLMRNAGNGRFENIYSGALNIDWKNEDMAPLFFDADSDGDLDLYIVSGGVECEPGDETLRDRLYFNDGSGKFKRATDALPDLRDSGSCVAGADFDRDGDIDLFVGGRSIPGKYPLSPNSRILRNDGGIFTDVTDTIAPALKDSGMVTSALWSDSDGDGNSDLLVAYEWGPVRLWKNEKSKLVDMTTDAGLADRLGWWNGIAGADIDHDGDIDYVVTNIGLNTKYHASPKHPMLLYYGDLDGSGKTAIVEAEFEGNVCYPVRGKSCSTAAMPSLGKKFPTYNKFALASLKDIYTDARLSSAKRFEANELQSGVLINDGNARFTFLALPRLAQAAPGFGVALTDFDGDGHVDACVAQNFFGPQVETGNMDGGLSLLLRGNGDGTFTESWPHHSGLIVPQDAKSLCVTDMNADGRPDAVFGINNGPVIAYVNNKLNRNRFLKVKIKGKPGNPKAAGARVTAHLSNGAKRLVEIHLGSGYLSQSSDDVFFGLGASNRIELIEVTWPDGKTSQFKPDPTNVVITVSY